ncbi:MAG: hypothetical protein KatS3mg102_0862 [Planctomycetota bacterium]|nr:MAG: hypothetical protein KatS3mg102_0862 [Planctomycetota bacterium]
MQGVMEMEELAAIHIAQGQLEEAVGVLREILEIDPECVEAHLQLATTLAQMGRTAEAVQEYARLAEALAGGSDVESANLRFLIEIYEKIVQLDPAHVAARQWLADAYRDKAEVDKALSQYEGLCQALRARGPSPELAEALARLVELRADDYDAREELGRVLAALGRKQEAARVLREACEQAQRAHRFDLARRIGETLLGVEPLDLETHRLLARIAVVDKDDARAFQRSSDAARLAAIARLDDACIECARKALELRADAEMRELLAEALARKEQAQEAAREMVEAGRLHLQAEDFGRAQRAAERAAQLDPGLQAARDLLYMIEARRQAGRGGGGAARAAAERPPDKPMITGGSPEVTIVDRPRRKHGSVAGVANKLKALKGGFGGGLDAAAPAAGGGLAAVSARLKAMKGGLGGAGGGGGQQAEPTSPEAAGWQRLPSDGEAASGSGKLSAADKLRRMKLGGASGPASAPPAAGGEQSASPAPPEGMQPASGGKKALSAAQKLRQLGRGGA